MLTAIFKPVTNTINNNNDLDRIYLRPKQADVNISDKEAVPNQKNGVY